MIIGPRWLQRRAARKAFERCYGVPYLRDLRERLRREHHGMLLLEELGEAERDIGWDRLGAALASSAHRSGA